jgi:hypothetical protein
MYSFEVVMLEGLTPILYIPALLLLSTPSISCEKTLTQNKKPISAAIIFFIRGVVRGILKLVFQP